MFDGLSSDSGFGFNPSMLTEAIKHQMPAEPFERLLKPIELHVPLDDFHSWLEHLKWMNKHDWSEFTNTQLVVPAGIMNALMSRAKRGKVDKWSRTVALLTMLTVTSMTGYAWTEEVVSSYLSKSDQNFVEAVIALLDALYQDRAQRAPAGPVAFYWIAQAAVLLPSLVAQCKGPTQVYLQWLEHLQGKRSKPVQEIQAADRVLAYLIKSTTDQKGEVPFRQPRRFLSWRERLRLFFGENKNRWTLGGALRAWILILCLLTLPLGLFLAWKSEAFAQDARKVDAGRKTSIDAAHAAFAKLHPSAP